jgi:hypothetical protein
MRTRGPFGTRGSPEAEKPATSSSEWYTQHPAKSSMYGARTFHQSSAVDSNRSDGVAHNRRDDRSLTWDSTTVNTPADSLTGHRHHLSCTCVSSPAMRHAVHNEADIVHRCFFTYSLPVDFSKRSTESHLSRSLMTRALPISAVSNHCI